MTGEVSPMKPLFRGLSERLHDAKVPQPYRGARFREGNVEVRLRSSGD